MRRSFEVAAERKGVVVLGLICPALLCLGMHLKPYYAIHSTLYVVLSLTRNPPLGLMYFFPNATLEVHLVTMAGLLYHYPGRVDSSQACKRKSRRTCLEDSRIILRSGLFPLPVLSDLTRTSRPPSMASAMKQLLEVARFLCLT